MVIFIVLPFFFNKVFHCKTVLDCNNKRQHKPLKFKQSCKYRYTIINRGHSFLPSGDSECPAWSKSPGFHLAFWVLRTSENYIFLRVDTQTAMAFWNYNLLSTLRPLKSVGVLPQIAMASGLSSFWCYWELKTFSTLRSQVSKVLSGEWNCSWHFHV